MKEIKELCKQCSNTTESPFFLSGIGTYCEECKVRPALGEYELRGGKWRSFAVFRGL